MKTTTKTWVLALCLTMLTFACSDDETSEPVITDDEAAEEIAASLSTEVTVFASDVVVAADDAENGRALSSGKTAACNVPYSATFTDAFAGTNVSYTYTIEYDYTLSCTNAGIPTTLSYGFSSNTTYSGPRLSSEGDSEGSLIVTGFELSATQYSMNGSFERAGSITQKARQLKTFVSTSDFTLTNLTVDKTTTMIKGGTGTVALNGTSSTGETYAVDASIVFNGDGTATVTIQGSVYEVSLPTGEVVLQ